MQVMTFNDDNLEKEKINENTTKVRAILINSKNEVLLADYGGAYLLPGGTLEKGETITKTLIRELKEELGLDIVLEDRDPDFLVEQLIKNYPKRNNQGNTDRLMTTYYYVIYTDEITKNNSVTLTEDEIKDGFNTFLIPMANICDFISNNQSVNPRNKYFSRELITVIQEYVKKLVLKNKYNTYAIYDDTYLAPGYFIISELNNEIVKFAKFYISNNFGFPHYNVRAYEKGSIDTCDVPFNPNCPTFRDIELSVTEGEVLFEAFKRFAIALNGTEISSIEPSQQGKNHLIVIQGANTSIVFSKDVYGVKYATDFIDINIGDYMTDNHYAALDEFYRYLAGSTKRETSEKDIQRILKLTKNV